MLAHEIGNRERLDKLEKNLCFSSNFRRNSENIGLKTAGIGALFANMSSGLITTSQEKRLDIAKAIDGDDDEALRALCINAEYITIAAAFTIQIQSPAKLMKILEMAR